MKRREPKTVQILLDDKPTGKETHIGLCLLCVECGAFRVFKIHDNITLVAKKKKSGFVTTSQCEKCGKRISVWIGLMEMKPGYSYISPTMSSKNSEIVADTEGLQAGKKKKNGS